MRRPRPGIRSVLLTVVVVGLVFGSWVARSAATDKPFAYPPTKKSDHVDVHHGVEVPDPYRWLEEPDSPDTRAWIEAENRITFAYLNEIPAREQIKKRMTDLWNYERYGLPAKKGGKYFFGKNDGLQDQSVLYWVESLDGEPKVLLDPNKLSEDGTVSLKGGAVSEDGKLLAYGLSKAGSDWSEWHVREIETGRDLDDHLEWIKFSGASWTKDGKGFFYSRFPEPSPDAQYQQANFCHQLYYHRLGTPQAQDELVYQRPDEKEWLVLAGVTEDGRYLILDIHKGSQRPTQLFYKDLMDPASEIVELITGWDAEYDFVGNDGPIFWFRTYLDAPQARVIAVDIRQPGRAHWKEIIPEAPDTLLAVSAVGGRFVASYLKDARSQIKVFDRDGKFEREVQLPGIGSAFGFSGKQEETETFYGFTGFATPTTVYRYDVRSGKSTKFREPKVDFDSAAYVTKQVFYPSKDGTRVPMFLTHKRGLKLDGHNPAILTAYGGFRIPMTPAFSVTNLVWMEMGGIFALANIRGGGEYGQKWHEAGMLAKKQNSFDDFIAAGEWLIRNGYTSTSRLAISGASNGGTLVGACMTQRPDLFGACLPDVGVMDMLRFHKFTIGWAWVSDYGSPEDPEQFKTLYSYSPLHNIKLGTAYPATLITTADHDDRVVPAHSFKFTAALQAAQSGTAPVLIRVETRAGHGSDKPTWMVIEGITDQFAFLSRVFDMGAG